MKKLFGLFLLAIAFLMPNAAYAVNCFWVGGTGTWDNSSTAHWAPTSGAAATGCQTTNAVPASGDIVTFDGSSGGGTVTVAATINGSNTVNQIVAGAFTGTLDFSVNNPSITLAGALLFSGTGNPRKFLMGTGTFTFTNTGGTVFDLATTTNLDGTSNFATASYVFTATTSSQRTWAGGARTYGPVVISANTSRGCFGMSQNNTFSTLTLAAGTCFLGTGSGTLTISTASGISISGTPSTSAVTSIMSGLPGGGTTLSMASGTFTCDYCYLNAVTGSGGATFSATNTYDAGRNTGWSITPPSVGGGGGKIIGG